MYAYIKDEQWYAVQECDANEVNLKNKCSIQKIIIYFTNSFTGTMDTFRKFVFLIADCILPIAN